MTFFSPNCAEYIKTWVLSIKWADFLTEICILKTANSQQPWHWKRLFKMFYQGQSMRITKNKHKKFDFLQQQKLRPKLEALK